MHMQELFSDLRVFWGCCCGRSFLLEEFVCRVPAASRKRTSFAWYGGRSTGLRNREAIHSVGSRVICCCTEFTVFAKEISLRPKHLTRYRLRRILGLVPFSCFLESWLFCFASSSSFASRRHPDVVGDRYVDRGEAISVSHAVAGPCILAIRIHSGPAHSRFGQCDLILPGDTDHLCLRLQAFQDLYSCSTSLVSYFTSTLLLLPRILGRQRSTRRR